MKIILLFCMVFGAFLPLSGANEEAPFWRKKEKVFSKIVEDRSIVVSVNGDLKLPGVRVLRMQGGGLLNAPIDHVFQEVQKFENLKLVSSHIRESRWEASKSELYLHTEAFRYHAYMTMKVSAASENDIKRKLSFEIINGHFKGMRGHFSFEKFKESKTIMGFDAWYEYKKLPMPKFFVEFGLEVMLQKVSSDMRSFLEKSYAL